MQLPVFFVNTVLSVEEFCNRYVFDDPQTSSRFVAAFLIPFVVSTTSVMIGFIVFETLLRIPTLERYHIKYNGKPHRFDGRKTKLPSTPFHDPDFAEALYDAFAAIALGAAGMFLLGLDEFSVQNVLDVSHLTVPSFWARLMARLVLIDFVAYLTHYMCHSSDFLWKYVHGPHHHYPTPTALTSSVGGMMETLFNASLPHLVATLSLRNHPIVVYTAMFCWGVESIHIHSGMSIPLVNVMPLNFVPLRASAAQHDLHHFSSGRKHVDLGFTLWIWDWLFGTASEAAARTARGMWTDYRRVGKPVAVTSWLS